MGNPVTVYHTVSCDDATRRCRLLYTPGAGAGGTLARQVHTFAVPLRRIFNGTSFF
jgi:hypothetical protein